MQKFSFTIDTTYDFIDKIHTFCRLGPPYEDDLSKYRNNNEYRLVKHYTYTSLDEINLSENVLNEILTYQLLYTNLFLLDYNLYNNEFYMMLINHDCQSHLISDKGIKDLSKDQKLIYNHYEPIDDITFIE